jgi:hypothetical protein
MEAILEGLVLRERGGGGTEAQQLFFNADFWKPKQEELHTDWDKIAEREKRSRTMFAQESIKVDDVRQELESVRAAIGSGVDVARFVKQASEAHQAATSGEEVLGIHFKESPRPLRERLRLPGDEIRVRFELPVKDDEVYVTRTHPLVEALATYVMDTAFDSIGEGVAKRCGAIRTAMVKERTTCLLLRFRYHIITTSKDGEQTLLAEDCYTAAFTGSPKSAAWLPSRQAQALLQLTPDTSIGPDIAKQHLRSVLADIASIQPQLNQFAEERGKELLDSHQRVRLTKGVTHRVEPKLPPDILGLYVFLP